MERKKGGGEGRAEAEVGGHWLMKGFIVLSSPPPPPPPPLPSSPPHIPNQLHQKRQPASKKKPPNKGDSSVESVIRDGDGDGASKNRETRTYSHGEVDEEGGGGGGVKSELNPTTTQKMPREDKGNTNRSLGPFFLKQRQKQDCHIRAAESPQTEALRNGAAHTHCHSNTHTPTHTKEKETLLPASPPRAK